MRDSSQPPSSGEAALTMIEVRHLYKDFITKKKYPGFRGAIKGLFSTEKVSTRAVDDMNFSIAAGEIVGYIGSNGAGKSTTIKMMTGIIAPSSGQCLVNGVDPRRDRMKNAANIGVVFGQRTQLWWDLPLSESFSILKEIYQVSDREYRQRLDFLNEVLGLPDFFYQPVRTLSLGQRMRADFGAALLHQPKVLFLDEPTIGLDVVVKGEIRRAIKQINEHYQTTVILTTHDLEDIEELCRRIIIIDKGRKIYDGDLAQLKQRFGKYRYLTVETAGLQGLEGEELTSLLGVKKEACRIELLPEQRRIRMTLDRQTVSVPQLLSALLQRVEVLDMSMTDVELTDIIRQIYQYGVED